MASGLVCPKCSSIRHHVIDSRPSGDALRRRRECKRCGERFTTLEKGAAGGVGKDLMKVGRAIQILQSLMPDSGWTPERDAILADMRNDCKSYVACGVALGISPFQVEKRCSLLGLENPDRRRFTWNEELEAALIQMRKEGKTYEHCADLMGLSVERIKQKCYKLGLNKRMNRGRMSGEEAVSRTNP